MTYASQQDFINVFGEAEMVQLTNLYDADASTINSEALERNQRKAFGLINGMIAACPGVAALMPFTEPYPDLLNGFELDITRYYLDSLSPREDVRLRFEDALKQLALIGKCQLSLGLVGTPAEVVEVSAGPIDYFAEELVWSGDALRGF